MRKKKGRGWPFAEEVGSGGTAGCHFPMRQLGKLTSEAWTPRVRARGLGQTSESRGPRPRR